MTRAREQLIHLESTPFYHCYVRCVRRAFLCGDDKVVGVNYDHRRAWLVSRLKFLSYVYAIDICAYAVMSNHYHVVLHVDKKRASEWELEEVVDRWTQLYSAPLLVKRWQKNPKTLGKAELKKVKEIIEQWRERLYDVSWFMRCVNEKIARMANEEDKVTGRFWEGRFKSQALLDEGALLSCMAYVDLNPIRADMAKSLEDSDFTSIQERLYHFAKRRKQKTTANKVFIKKMDAKLEQAQDPKNKKISKAKLMKFDGRSHTRIQNALPITREDYFLLVEATGRVVREDKRGAIPPDIIQLANRYGIKPDKWLKQVRNFDRCFSYCAGDSEAMVDFAQMFNRKWAKGCGRQVA